MIFISKSGKYGLVLLAPTSFPLGELLRLVGILKWSSSCLPLAVFLVERTQ